MTNQAQTSADTNLNHVGLTDEDRAIFRRLLSVGAQGAITALHLAFEYFSSEVTPGEAVCRELLPDAYP